MNKGLMKKLVIFLAPVFLLAATVGAMLYANKIVGIYSQQNWLLNGDFEKNTYGSGLVSGGSTSLSIINDPSIYGNALLVTSPATNAEIVFGIDSNIGSKLSGLNCEARFNLNLFSSNLTPTVVEVDVIRNAGSLRLSNVQTITMRQSGWTPMSVNFPCASVISASSARIKVTSAGSVASGNVEFVVDSMYVGEATNIISLANIGEWQAYTPASTQGLGTPSAISLKYRVNGGGIDIEGRITVGTPSAVEGRVALPSGFTSSANYTTLEVVGNAASSGVNNAMVTLVEPNVSYLTFGYDNSGTSALGKRNGSDFVTTGGSLSFRAHVRVNGLSATQSAITQQCIQDGSCVNEFSAEVSAAGVVSNENVDFINGNCAITSTTTNTCTYKTSMFSAGMNCSIMAIKAGASYDYYPQLVSSTSTDVSWVYKSISGATASNIPSKIVCQRGTGDYKPRFTAPALVGSVTSNSQSALRDETLKASQGVTCSTTPCTINWSTSDWATSVTRTSAGRYVVNLQGFSSPPACFAQTTQYMTAHDGVATLTTFSYGTFNASGTYSDAATHTIRCIGPR